MIGAGTECKQQMTVSRCLTLVDLESVWWQILVSLERLRMNESSGSHEFLSSQTAGEDLGHSSASE